MSNGSCPECLGEVVLEPITEVGEILVCGDCGVDLEVMALEPTAALALAPMEEEDWGE